jgi:hypothetical protein
LDSSKKEKHPAFLRTEQRSGMFFAVWDFAEISGQDVMPAEAGEK